LINWTWWDFPLPAAMSSFAVVVVGRPYRARRKGDRDFGRCPGLASFASVRRGVMGMISGIPWEGVWDLNTVRVTRLDATFYLLACLTNFDGRR